MKHATKGLGDERHAFEPEGRNFASPLPRHHHELAGN